MTWLKFVNVFFLQWFFIRLTKHQDVVKGKVGLQTVNLAVDDIPYYSIQYCILPITGWWGSYTFLNKTAQYWYINKHKRKQKALELKQVLAKRELEDKNYEAFKDNINSWLLLRPILHLTQKEFDDLPEYSCSVPTGTIIGKRWKCNYIAFKSSIGAERRQPFWVIYEYVKHSDPKLVGIDSYQLIITN